MRPDLPAIPSFLGALTIEDFESPPAVLFLSLLFVQGGGMDLSRVGEKLLSSVRSATSLGILPAPSDRPEVPARAAAAAAVARALAGIPPHQRISLPSSSEELISIYGSNPHGQSVEELEEDYYEEAFDPVKNILENVPSEEDDLNYFEKKATLRLAQLDRIAERLSRHVMEHHEEMVKGMQLVMELEQDLKVANVICMNGRRHLTSAMHEVSRDLVVNSSAKKKQALLDLLPILTDLSHALEMQIELETLVEEGNFFRAFQVLSEYLQVLDSFSELAAIQEMSRGVEAWLARALQKLDSLLLGVCQTFEEESYITVVDAYALIGDISGLAEKIQSFFMQEVLSETHAVLKDIVQEDIGQKGQRNRLTYSDLCSKIPESKFRQCLLKTMDTLFKLLCSYYSIMSFQPKEKYSESPSSNIRRMQDETSQCSEGVLLDSSSGVSSKSSMHSGLPSESVHKMESSSTLEESYAASSSSVGDFNDHLELLSKSVHDAGDDVSKTSSTESPFYHLRRDATTYVAQTLGRGRKNIWQLTTSRVSVLLSCSAVCSTSTHQFLRNYEDLNVFILAGEAFSGVEAVEFRHRLKNVSENYLASFHRQNIYALKMVLEKETWVKISSDTMQVISLAGLTGDGAPLIAPAVNSATVSVLHSEKMSSQIKTGNQKNGFVHWLNIENPFSSKIACGSKDSMNGHTMPNGSTVSSLTDRSIAEHLHSDRISSERNYVTPVNGSPSVAEDENEDLLADFIDEDSQLPSRISKPLLSRNSLAPWNGEEINAQTGSSLCLLRLMDKYARLMQKLEMVNVEFFKGICQLFGIFFHFIFETFVQRDTHLNGKILRDSLPYRLKLALSRVTQDCDQWIRSQSITSSCSSPTSSHNTPFTQMDVTPTIPASTVSGHAPFGLKERCAGAETISLVAHVLHRSKSHLQSMLLQNKSAVIEDFFENLVDSVPDLTEQIHRTTARSLLHINGYADRIANAKWEIKELGLEHNGYVDLLLGEFKHYKTRLAHGGLQKEVQDLLLEYGLENVAEVLIEGLSRVKRCTDEGRALMSLDLQVLINGLGHFASINVKPKLQVVETFIKAYYLPETEYVHWARSHPEYTKSQIVGLINLVATNKGWKRKTKSEVLERIEAGN